MNLDDGRATLGAAMSVVTGHNLWVVLNDVCIISADRFAQSKS